jgi:hypothetical protein
LFNLPTIALRRAAFSLILFVVLFVVGGMARPPASTQTRISIEQQHDGRLIVTYELGRLRDGLNFLEVGGDYREQQWKIVTPGFRFIKENDYDRIERLNGGTFNRVVISATPNPKRFTKEYQPIALYGEGGVMVYTGHFSPVDGRGGRVPSTFSFKPEGGAQVVAFGERSDALVGWHSPLAQPAFIYMGPLIPVETPDVMAVIDPDAPQWIRDEFYELTPRVFAHLTDVFGFSLTTKPNLFLAAPLGDGEGRLSYAGDALPGQFQITLVGAAWKNRTKQALDIFRSSTVHEAVHLWQSAARPKGITTAAWIHEGAADAMAVEVLLATNYWDEADRSKYFIGARDECARGLKFGSLASTRERQNFRAMYACGHVIAEAVSLAEGQPVTEFWRAFIARAQAQNGYTQNTYFDLALERTGNARFVNQLRYFVRTPLANPDREIGRLLAAAKNPGNSSSDDPPLAQAGTR